MQSSFKAKEDLPAILSATDISRYLGISKANSYQLMDSKGFPILRIGKRNYVYDGYKDFLTELRKIGTNVNQIARACNSGEISNPNLVVFQRELKSIWQSLKSKPPKEI